MKDLALLERELQITFRNRDLLKQALVHRSYLNERPEALQESNERLEFLGDALLSVVTAEALYHRYPKSTEGELTELRAALVRRESLAKIAQELHLGQYLYLGQGEKTSGGMDRTSNLAAVLEALVGAALVDGGYGAARELALRLLAPALEEADRQDAFRDAKSQLQEVVQRQGLPLPTYRIVETRGPEHQREFLVEVVVGDRVMGKGVGRRKSEAEKAAASEALKAIVPGA